MRPRRPLKPLSKHEHVNVVPDRFTKKGGYKTYPGVGVIKKSGVKVSGK